MTLKIEKYADEYSTTIRLIGRVQAEHLAELKTQIKESGPKIAMDLEEVDLVDVEVVRFLGRVKHKGSSTTGSAKNAI
jgi:anti-anti-sigma regulatory factor